MDERRFSALTEQIYTAAFDDAGWDSLLEALRVQFHVSLVISFVWDRIAEVPLYASSTIQDGSVTSKYEAYYHNLDPFYHKLDGLLSAFDRTIKQHRNMQVFPNEAILPYSAFHKTEFYQDFVRPYDLSGNDLVVLAGKSEHTHTIFHFHSPMQSEEFDGEEIKQLAALAPHLKRGLHTRQQMAGLRANANLFEAAFDELANAVFLLDATGPVLRFNARAKQLMDARQAITVRNGRLVALHPRDNMALQAATRPQPAWAPPAGLILRGPVPTSNLRLTVTPLQGHTLPLWVDVHRRAQVAFMVTATHYDPLSANSLTLVEHYGLTPAEAEVAQLLADGLGPRQIAARRGKSINTIKAQIKQIYAKTGASGHAARLTKLFGGEI